MAWVLHFSISPPTSPKGRPSSMWWKMHFSNYLFNYLLNIITDYNNLFHFQSFWTNVTSLIMFFFFSHPKLVMMTYLCQIFIWRERLSLWMSVWNMKTRKVLPSHVQRWEYLKEDTTSSSPWTPGLPSIPVLKDDVEVLSQYLCQMYYWSFLPPQPSWQWCLKKTISPILSSYPSDIPGKLDRNGIF